MPPWAGSPHGTLPGVVALELVLARSERAAVCVTRVAAYPTGFEVDLVTMASADSDFDLDPLMFGRRHGGARIGPRAQEIPEEMLRFGVQFADGSKATNLGPRHHGPGGDGPPLGPVLHQQGGGGGGGNWRQTLWIWPLPPPGPLSFVVEWPAAGVALTRHEIDAQLIRDAALRAQVIFSEDDLPDLPGFRSATLRPS